MRNFFLVLSIFVIIGIVSFYYIENDPHFRADIRNFLIDTNLKNDFDRPYDDSNNKPFSYYAVNESISIIPLSNQNSAQNIPSKLIIDSGTYSIYENVYDLKNEGLYRFVFPGVENSQRIVYDGKNIENLLSAISWIYTHGNSDSGKSFDELNQKAMQSKIYGLCDTISIWLLDTLREQNISSRLVQTMTLDEWNSYDNGHTMIEIYRDDLRKWVVYDLDNNAFFTYNGKPLSLVEFVNHVQHNDYKITFLASDAKMDISNFKRINDAYDYAFVAESVMANEDTLRNWYSRIIQVALIQGEDLEFYFSDSENQLKIENFAPNYHFIEETQFLNNFYG